MNKFVICALVLIAVGLSYGKSIDQAEVKEIRDYIVLGINLPNQDKDISDPFLVVSNAAGSEIYRSDTSDNTLNPVFSPLLEINYLTGDIYEFEVRDNDPLNPDESLGTVTLNVDELEGTHLLSTGGSIQVNRI